MQRLIDKLIRDGLAPATIDAALTPLRSLCRRTVARGEAQVKPTRGIEEPAVRSAPKRIASQPRLRRCSTPSRPRTARCGATDFYTGLRRGELIALRWDDVDFPTSVIQVKRGWDHVEGAIAPKSRQGIRAVPIPAVLRDYLVEPRMRGGEGRVFAPTARCEAAPRPQPSSGGRGP
jgi:integrase